MLHLRIFYRECRGGREREADRSRVVRQGYRRGAHARRLQGKDGEVNYRTHGRDEFPTIIVSHAKCSSVLWLHPTFSLPFFFVARFSDRRTMFCREDALGPPQLVIGGRTTQTRDSADIEPVCHNSV